MSASCSVVTRPSGNGFFGGLPGGVSESVLAFLQGKRGTVDLDHDAFDVNRNNRDDRSVIITATVCKEWQSNSVLDNARKIINLRHIRYQENEAAYPLRMRQLFKNCNLPIGRLAVLDLGGRMGNTNYINFIQPGDMSQPVMRFWDKYGRPGVALKIKASSEINRSYIMHGMRGTPNFQLDRAESKEVVLALFKRYVPTDEPTWAYEWGGGNSIIERIYSFKHRQNGCTWSRTRVCPTCPFRDVERPSDSALQAFLTNQDKDFTLSGYDEDQAIAGRRRLQRAIEDQATASNIGVPQRADENRPIANNSGISRRAIFVATAVAALAIVCFRGFSR